MTGPGTFSRRKLIAVAAIVGGICAGVSGCALFGADKENQMQANLANQRKVAVKLVKDYPNPDLESIEFTNPGSVGGSGSWAANAVITVAGIKYNGFLGTLMSSGDGLPSITAEAEPERVTLIYSDGTSEVLNDHG